MLAPCTVVRPLKGETNASTTLVHPLQCDAVTLVSAIRGHPCKMFESLAKISELTCDIILAIYHPGHVVAKSIAAKKLAFKLLTLSVPLAVPRYHHNHCE